VNAEIIQGNTRSLDNPHALDGVLSRRIFAFVIDYLLIGLLTIPFAIVVFMLGLLTLGLGWLLFGVLVPAVALIYIWNTLGGPNQATPGMRAFGIRLERFDGSRIDGLTAIVHSLLFWVSVTVLTPLILLATLFLDYKRTLHDLLLGTVVVRKSV
jgi:uncharacterized RDD family membrane protein YckC